MKLFQVCVVVLAVSGASAEILTNGSFEVPAFASNGGYAFPTNSGWAASESPAPSIRRGSLDPYCGDWFGAADGAQFVKLSPGAWIEQAFSTVPGEDYEIQLQAGSDQVHVYNIYMEIVVRSHIGETNLEAFVTLPGASQNEWLPKSRFLFMATGTNSILRFRDISPQSAHKVTCTAAIGDARLTLDDVSVELAPLSPSIHVSQVTLCWEALTNHFYQVQFTTNLSAEVWMDLGVPLTNISGIQCVTDSAEGNPNRFYRILRWQ